MSHQSRVATRRKLQVSGQWVDCSGYLVLFLSPFLPVFLSRLAFSNGSLSQAHLHHLAMPVAPTDYCLPLSSHIIETFWRSTGSPPCNSQAHTSRSPPTDSTWIGVDLVLTLGLDLAEPRIKSEGSRVQTRLGERDSMEGSAERVGCAQEGPVAPTYLALYCDMFFFCCVSCKESRRSLSTAVLIKQLQHFDLLLLKPFRHWRHRRRQHPSSVSREPERGLWELVKHVPDQDHLSTQIQNSYFAKVPFWDVISDIGDL